ncbi:hypothetical protein ONZ43_g7719 [Nemania bipapillata]|uniref:Uncharacterized protein n=1 Tax=Nemania bipapillata TaxID=110536 RepID=A0ACC2HPM8_9PEZI|nr:hypothetical protein ONZ43_g7719 [Nemania bipapillata]
MEPHNRPDGPPPPYSETDIYSHSHISRHEHLSVADDDVSIAPSSSHSNIIDTPPESPHDDTQYNFPGPHGDQHVTASAQAYFDSRPPNRSGPNVTIDLEITPTSTPADFPYPKKVHDRDISEQDWQTFINYLIPEHAARANSHIIARKLRMADDDSSSASSRIVQAHLASLKSSASVSASPQNVDSVVREWNRSLPKIHRDNRAAGGGTHSGLWTATTGVFASVPCTSRGIVLRSALHSKPIATVSVGVDDLRVSHYSRPILGVYAGEGNPGRVMGTLLYSVVTAATPGPGLSAGLGADVAFVNTTGTDKGITHAAQ